MVDVVLEENGIGRRCVLHPIGYGALADGTLVFDEATPAGGHASVKAAAQQDLLQLLTFTQPTKHTTPSSPSYMYDVCLLPHVCIRIHVCMRVCVCVCVCVCVRAYVCICM